MFQVDVDREFVIKECPRGGLEAVEFRRKYGLPLEPHNRIRIKMKVERPGWVYAYQLKVASDIDSNERMAELAKESDFKNLHAARATDPNAYLSLWVKDEIEDGDVEAFLPPTSFFLDYCIVFLPPLELLEG
jgi:hypothetical protein